MKLVLLGGIGAGKSTQGTILSGRYGITHISTGDIFREHMQNKTELGLKIESIFQSGGLVSDEITNEILLARILEDDCKNGFVLDGYPRTEPQAEILDAAADIDRAIFIDLDDSVVIARLGGRRICRNCKATYHIKNLPPKVEGICDNCGRPLVMRDEDAMETVLKRLSVFHEVTKPIVNYYKERNILVTVDGTGSIDEVAGHIFKALEADQ